MAVIEEAQCKIKYLNSQGLGIGKTELGEVILPYTIENEIVDFERHAYRRNTNCLLKAIITTSTDRIEPKCKYFGACGGCLLQHIKDEAYLKFKTNIIKSLLDKSNIATKINDLIIIPPGLRRRANLKGIKKNEKIFLGFQRFNSHQIIDIIECPAILGELSNLIPSLKIVLNKILDDKQKIDIFLTKAKNGIDISIDIDSSIDTDKQKKLIEFAEQNHILRINLIHQNKTITIYQIEIPYILLGKIKVEIDAKSFLQSSFMSDEILSQLVLKTFENFNKEKTSIIDLFCGRGTFTIPLSNFFLVDGFESEESAILSLKKACLETNISINLFQRDLFLKALTSKELSKYHGAVINPPRAGAEAQCKQLKNSSIEKICYVSCNPETFIKDVKILQKGGYKLVEVTPVDQFYWTPHLELVGIMQKL